MPRAIIFFGPDGAGKTTQVRLLVRYLESRGSRTWWTWIRGRHSIAFLLARFLRRFGYYNVVKRGKQVYKVFDPRLMPRMARLWTLIEFVSVLPLIIKRMYLPMLIGYTVVAERYVVDTLVYLGYWVSPKLFQSLLGRILLAFIPKNSVLFFLDAETDMLLKRIVDDDVTSEFIRFQQESYRIFAKALDANTINTSEHDVQEVFQRVLKEIAD